MKKILFAAAIFMLSAMNVMAQDKVFVEDFSIKAGQTVDVKLDLTNSTPYAAIQCEITFPEGTDIAISKATGNYRVTPNVFNEDTEEGRTIDHTAALNKVSSGAYRFVISSMTSSNFVYSEGTILTIKLQAADTYDGAAFTGKVDAVVLVKANGEKVEIGSTTFQVNGETGIKDIKANATSDSPIYDLQGRRVEKTTKGLYIVNGNKVVMK